MRFPLEQKPSSSRDEMIGGQILLNHHYVNSISLATVVVDRRKQDKTVVLEMAKTPTSPLRRPEVNSNISCSISWPTHSTVSHLSMSIISCHRHEHFLTPGLMPDEHHVRRSRSFRGSEERTPMNLTRLSGDSPSN